MLFYDVKRNLITIYNKQLNYSTATTPTPMRDGDYLNPLFHTEIIEQGKIITAWSTIITGFKLLKIIDTGI